MQGMQWEQWAMALAPEEFTVKLKNLELIYDNCNNKNCKDAVFWLRNESHVAQYFASYITEKPLEIFPFKKTTLLGILKSLP